MGEPGPAAAAALPLPSTRELPVPEEGSVLRSPTGRNYLDALAGLELDPFPLRAMGCCRAGVIERGGV